ncbi:MAG: hypothetical protein PHQ96_08040 [Candidatus Omnitrophica bacterium]|nr:hypothetical protein [Candidatus Omnitrophota bacterium]
MLTSLSAILKQKFSYAPNNNQLRYIAGLIFEIQKRENVSLEEILDCLAENSRIKRAGGRDKFFPLRECLIKRRFPLTSAIRTIHPKEVFLNISKNIISDNFSPSKEFTPLQIFVEDAARDSILHRKFASKFPRVPVTAVARYSDYLKENKFRLAELKKPVIFIVKESWDFIKPCPCTKGHLSCGYWIFNVGFGCPFDCSYCFLQHYANFPGIILPANLNDFFDKFNKSSLNNLKKPIRIGTGEFCDSLALDEITGYSSELIPFFKDKNVLFELKTKSDKIANLLSLEPAPNIVISWSLNPSLIAAKDEIGAPSLKRRIEAASKLQKKGYRLGFHFDPIIHSGNWQELYRQTIEELYSILRPGFAWISLGTLRGMRQLKINSQMRFPKSDIFYGELFLGEDKKLRYPQFLRKEIYSKMISWIKEYDKKTPIYLCMEDNGLWKVVGDKFNTAADIEDYLIPHV